MTAKWLSEPDRPTDLPWFFDAPWETANERARHLFVVRGGQTDGLVCTFHASSRLAKVDRRTFLRQVLYGDPTVNEREMIGLSRHYGTRDAAEAQNAVKAQSAVNVLDAGGDAARPLCSIWLLGWGPRTIFMASPDGQPPGMFGECCVVVADWRYAVRVAHVDAASPDFDPLEWMVSAIHRLPTAQRSDSLRPIFYVNGDVEGRIADAVGNRLDGPYRCHLRGIPVRRVDELRSDEARVRGSGSTAIATGRIGVSTLKRSGATGSAASLGGSGHD